MRRVLVINPNTSESVSARLQACLGNTPGVQVHTVTARFGAPYIACEASYAVAAHAVLDTWAWARSRAAYDAVLIACFGDPGLFALREICPLPITGLAEAAFARAARHGRFAVVTGGAAWGPMLQRLALALGYGQALAAIETVEASGIALASDPQAAQHVLGKACERVAHNTDARSIIIGGAGLAGLAQALQADTALPLLDSVDEGMAHIVSDAVTAGAGQTPGFVWHGVGPELSAWGAAA